MTSSSADAALPHVPRRTPDLGASMRRLARATVRYAEARRDSWTGQLEGAIEPDGATDRAVTEGLKAWATGGNPVSAALRGAWAGADTKSRVAIVGTLLLVAVLAPVLLVLLLLGLLVTALVLKARAATAGT
jgi:hypothetical protein